MGPFGWRGNAERLVDREPPFPQCVHDVVEGTEMAVIGVDLELTLLPLFQGAHGNNSSAGRQLDLRLGADRRDELLGYPVSVNRSLWYSVARHNRARIADRL